MSLHHLFPIISHSAQHGLMQSLKTMECACRFSSHNSVLRAGISDN